MLQDVCRVLGKAASRPAKATVRNAKRAKAAAERPPGPTQSQAPECQLATRFVPPREIALPRIGAVRSWYFLLFLKNPPQVLNIVFRQISAFDQLQYGCWRCPPQNPIEERLALLPDAIV